ncbi:DUF2381 family protein [Archangium violaceum]|uniref:DUF2381 family protein n=1 Tax=Archangium violaceum TaxID=83451 RepID=UPI00193C53B2|nr:DUF2381 family protein [Archangium violaceum]QRK13367.1 DUF2381 family protein [Archangium violaceum]
MLKLPLPVLLLVALPGKAAQVPAAPLIECGAELQNVELEVGSLPMLVCVAPEVATTLRFDTPLLLERTVLEGSEVSFSPTPMGMSLEATRDLAEGERRKLTVYFADEKEPSSATFILVGQGSGKPRQVNVFRQTRTVASLRQEAQQQRQRAEVCEQQLAQCSKQAAPTTLLERLLRLGRGSRISLHWRDVKPQGGQRGDIDVSEISTTTVELEHGEREAAVRVRLANNRQEDWRVEGASLTAGGGQPLTAVRVLPEAALPAGAVRRIDVVLGPTQQELTGRYTLRLWGGGLEIALENIEFP